MWQRASLKQRLLALVLGAITLVWLLATAFTYHDAREELDELLDAHLAQAATLLVAQAAHDPDELETEHAPLLHKYSRRSHFRCGRMANISACTPPTRRSSRWRMPKTASATA